MNSVAARLIQKSEQAEPKSLVTWDNDSNRLPVSGWTASLP
jgi:hypothetical protein